MAELIWSAEALADLDGIYDFIARDSHQYARHQLEKILGTVERLQTHPESGRRIPEFPHMPHREVIVQNYRVVYRYDAKDSEVYVVAVVHARCLFTEKELG